MNKLIGCKDEITNSLALFKNLLDADNLSLSLLACKNCLNCCVSPFINDSVLKDKDDLIVKVNYLFDYNIINNEQYSMFLNIANNNIEDKELLMKYYEYLSNYYNDVSSDVYLIDNNSKNGRNNSGTDDILKLKGDAKIKKVTAIDPEYLKNNKKRIKKYARIYHMDDKKQGTYFVGKQLSQFDSKDYLGNYEDYYNNRHVLRVVNNKNPDLCLLRSYERKYLKKAVKDGTEVFYYEPRIENWEPSLRALFMSQFEDEPPVKQDSPLINYDYIEYHHWLKDGIADGEEAVRNERIRHSKKQRVFVEKKQKKQANPAYDSGKRKLIVFAIFILIAAFYVFKNNIINFIIYK